MFTAVLCVHNSTSSYLKDKFCVASYFEDNEDVTKSVTGGFSSSPDPCKYVPVNAAGLARNAIFHLL